MDKFRGPIWSLLIAACLAVVCGLPSAANATPVSVTVDSGFRQRPDADVTIKDSSGTVVKTGKTAVPAGSGRPQFTTDLAPGTYTIEASWLNDQGRTETGTQTYTVTAGKNETNVAVAEGGYQNPPGSGTIATANGVTVTGQTNGAAPPARRQFNPVGEAVNASGMPISRTRMSFTSEYFSHNTDGVNTIPLFTGGNDNGGSLIKEDANTHGFRNELRVGAGGNNLAGADRFHVNFGLRHGWGITKMSAGRLTVPAGQTGDVPGIGALNNVAITNADNVSTESEIDSFIGFVGFGLRYALGPIGNFSIGNLTIGNLGGVPDGRGLTFSPSIELFGGVEKQRNNVSFLSGAAAHVIEDNLKIFKAGGRVRAMLGIPVAPRLHFKIGPEIGLIYNDSTLKATQLQNVSTGEEKVDDSNFSFTTGISAALNYRFAKGWSAGLTGSFENEFDRPVAELTRSNSAGSKVGSADDFKYSAGVKVVADPAVVFSDRRLKTNIARIGALPSGLPVYRYNYIWSSDTHIGVMAQEAAELFPEAVREVDGFLAVDYSRIR